MDSYALQFYFAAVGWVFWPRGPEHRVQPDLGMTSLFGRQPSVPDIYAGGSIGKSRKIHSRAGRCDDTGFGSRRRYVRSPHFRHLLIILIYDECFMCEFLSKYLYFSLKNI